MYFVIYGLGRFLIEGLRTDSLYIIPGIRVSQVLSLFLICGGILLLYIFVRRNKTKMCILEDTSADKTAVIFHPSCSVEIAAVFFYDSNATIVSFGSFSFSQFKR